MADHEQFLTDTEQSALDLHKSLKQARTIQEWVGYAGILGMSEEAIGTGAKRIRSLTPSQLKKLRKAFATVSDFSTALEATQGSAPAAAETLNDELPPSSPLAEYSEPVEISESENGDEEAELEVDSMKKEAAHDTLVSESLELSPKSVEWTRNNLNITIPNDASLEEATQMIMKLANPPVTFIGKNRRDTPVNTEQRVKLKLAGRSYKEIADIEGMSTASAVQQWFSVHIIKLIKGGVNTEANTQQLLPEPEHPILEKNATRDAEIIVIDTNVVAKNLTKLFKFDDDQEALLVDLLDPNYYLELSGSHKSTRHHFRLKMASKLPPLEDSQLDLNQNEISRLNALFGRAKNDRSKWKYDQVPQSVYQASLYEDHFDQTRRDNVLTGLQKVHDFLLSNTLQNVSEQVPSDDESQVIVESLMKIDFTHDEAVALMECFEFDGNSPKKRRDDAPSALNKLQKLLIKRSKDITDHPALPGLRTLSNQMFGQKTVFDVYLSMHKGNTRITQDGVTKILKDGTNVLINGKERDS